jgi:hypothetical protein
VERADHVAKIRLEIKERTEVGVLEDAGAQGGAGEACEASDDGIESNVGGRNKLYGTISELLPRASEESETYVTWTVDQSLRSDVRERIRSLLV